jgi:hypothetical protein
MPLYYSMTLSTFLYYAGVTYHIGHGSGCNLLVILTVNHEEVKIPDLRVDLPTFHGRDQGNGCRWNYLGYSI